MTNTNILNTNSSQVQISRTTPQSINASQIQFAKIQHAKSPQNYEIVKNKQFDIKQSQVRYGSELGFTNAIIKSNQQNQEESMQQLNMQFSNKRGSVQSLDKANKNSKRGMRNQIFNTDQINDGTSKMPRQKEKTFIIKKSQFKKIRENNDKSVIMNSSVSQSQISSPLQSPKKSNEPLNFTQLQNFRNNIKINDFQEKSKKSMKQSRQQHKLVFSEQNSPIRDQLDNLNISIPQVSRLQDQMPQQQISENNQMTNQKQQLLNRQQQSETMLANHKQKRNNNKNKTQVVSAKSSMLTDDDFNDSHFSSQYFLNRDGSPESDQLAMRKRKNFQSFEKSNLKQNFPKRQVTQNFEAIKKNGRLSDNFDVPQSAEFKIRGNNLQSQNGSNANNNQSSTFETTLNANPAILALSNKPQIQNDQQNQNKQSSQNLQIDLYQKEKQYASFEHIAILQKEIDRLKHLVKKKDTPIQRSYNQSPNQVFQRRRPGTSNKNHNLLLSQSQQVSPKLLNDSGFFNLSQSQSKELFFMKPNRQNITNQQIRNMISKTNIIKKLESSDALQEPLTNDSQLVLNLEGRNPFQIQIPERIRPNTSGSYGKSKLKSRKLHVEEQIPQISHIMLEHDPLNGRLGFSQNDQQIQLDESHYHPTFIAKDIEEIRNNPETRKILKQFQLFSGVSNVDTKNNQIRKSEQDQDKKKNDNKKIHLNTDQLQINANQQANSQPQNNLTNQKVSHQQKDKFYQINSDLQSVIKNDKITTNSKGDLLNIPTSTIPIDKINISSPSDQQLSQLHTQKQLEKKFNNIQTPPMRSSKKSNLMKQSVPIIKIQRSNSNQFLKAPTQDKSLQNQVINTSNRRDSDLLSVTQNLNALKFLRKESHESNQYHQKLSLTSVLTPSFARNQVDTPSGKSDFSFAIQDMFSERSSGGSSLKFSEGQKKTLPKGRLSHKNQSSLILARKQFQNANITRFDSHDQKSRQGDQFTLMQQQSSNFSFHQHLSKEISLNLRPAQIAEKQMKKIIEQQQEIEEQNRKQPYEYLKSKIISCSIKVLQPNHIYKGNKQIK